MPAINTSLILPLPFQQQTEVDTSAIPQSFMRAYEMAKRQNDPLEALRRASIEMDLTAKSFEISKHFEDRQRLLDAERQARQAAPSIQSLLQQQKPYEALLALQTEAAKNPNLLNSPTWNSLGKTVSTSAEISDKLKDTEARVLRDRETMRHNLAMETKPPAPGAAAQDIALQDKALAELKYAQQTGNPEAIAAAEDRYKRVMERTVQSGETIEAVDPATGKTIVKVQRGGTGRAVADPTALTPTNRTKVQEGLAQSIQTIDVANRLEPLISDETVGAKAFVESWAKDRILAQWFPGMASEDRGKAESLASELRASVIKEVRSDSNISEPERQQILESVPDINDPVDSPARAKQLIRQSRRMAATKAMVKAKALGVGVPKAVADVLDDETLVDLFKQGLITQEQAKEAYKLRRAQ